ncbi:MAG: chaperonin Cpn10 [Candidatus Adlerbacteria bacterium]|nr:chaperonin Cpn10 [Candidatus Adlerbacteria bacterium]
MKKKAKAKQAKKKAPAAKQKSAAPKVIAKNKAGLTPLGDRVLVKPLSAEEGMTTSFGIIIPDTAKEKPEQGMVVAVGPGKRGDDNELVPVSVKIGDRVMFSKYGYDEVKVAGVEYYLVREDNIVAILD